MHMFIERKYLLKENETKAFSLILNSYCTKPMQNRVQDHPKYESKIMDDPVRLLEEIKTLTHDTVQAQYPIASIVEQLATWINIQQHDEENLTEYMKRGSITATSLRTRSVLDYSMATLSPQRNTRIAMSVQLQRQR